MMRSDGKLTRENVFDLIKEFARAYRKELGKVPGEIIIVGGGSILLNYNFREATQDLDVILKTTSDVKAVIRKFAEDNDLPDDWMNGEFIKTASYSDKLVEVSKHFYTMNNGSLEIRTVSGVYLIAMKLMARRDYRNDISDAIGILIEERKKGNNISYNDIEVAFDKLYKAKLPDDISSYMTDISNMDMDELVKYYNSQKNMEKEIGGRIVKYIDDGANINARNVEDVIDSIKKKMSAKK